MAEMRRIERSAEDPDPTVEIHQSPAGPGLGSKTGEGYSEGRLQALARSESYDAAEAKAWEVRAALHRKRITASDGTVYHVLALQRPFDLGTTDGTDRFVFSQNLDLTIVPEGAPPQL